MSRYLELILIDGSKVVIETDEPIGAVKAGRGARKMVEITREVFEEAIENGRKAALLVLEKVRSSHEPPDQVEITFGLKASGELGSFVVAKAGIEASYAVKLTWKKEPNKGATKS